MKTLSIQNPWAWLICAGYKDVENRTWKTNYRGRILIHVSKKWDITGCDICYRAKETRCNLGTRICDLRKNTGEIIGEVTITDCVRNHPSEWAESNCYNWVLADPVLYAKPILNIKGRLGLWEYQKEIKQ